MKIVYTYCTYEKQNTQYIDKNIIRASLNLVKKAGYETIVYVDENNIDKINNFEFDEVRIINSKLLEGLPVNVWSLGKLITFSQINEPFCHIDFDVFLLKNVIKKFKKEKLFAFHLEGWRPMDHFNPFYNKICHDMNIQYSDMKTYNCAVIGGTAFKEINESAKLVLDYAKKESNFLNYHMKNLLNQNNNWLLPVLLEQIFFMNICKNKLSLAKIKLILNCGSKDNPLKSEYVYKEMIKNNIFHLWGDKHNFMLKMYNQKKGQDLSTQKESRNSSPL
jgi:hypothetical protein